MVLFAEYIFPGTFENHAPLCPSFPPPSPVSASFVRRTSTEPTPLGSAAEHSLVGAAASHRNTQLCTFTAARRGVGSRDFEHRERHKD